MKSINFLTLFFLISFLVIFNIDIVFSASCTPSPCVGSCADPNTCQSQNCPPVLVGGGDCKFTRDFKDYNCYSKVNTCTYSCGTEEVPLECKESCDYIWSNCDVKQTYCDGASINCIGQYKTFSDPVQDACISTDMDSGWYQYYNNPATHKDCMPPDGENRDYNQPSPKDDGTNTPNILVFDEVITAFFMCSACPGTGSTSNYYNKNVETELNWYSGSHTCQYVKAVEAEPTAPTAYPRLGFGDTNNPNIQPESCKCAAIDGYEMATINDGWNGSGIVDPTIDYTATVNPWDVRTTGILTSLNNPQPDGCCGNNLTEYFRQQECKSYACPTTYSTTKVGCCNTVESCIGPGGSCYAPILPSTDVQNCEVGISGDAGEYSVCVMDSASKHYVWDDQDTNEDWCNDITSTLLSHPDYYCITGFPGNYDSRSCWMADGEQFGPEGVRDGATGQNFCCGDEPEREAFRIVECGDNNNFCPYASLVECCDRTGVNDLPALNSDDICVGSWEVDDLDDSGGVSISLVGKWWDPDDACNSDWEGCIEGVTAVNCAPCA
ncbi:MAG: hypothetical protein K0B02_03595 [DPANN group archaeon]|nr:hypothetical protein [DPANN group archaeon]